MESIFSKTTLYDIMSMIIPGFIALVSLSEIFFGKYVTQIFGGSFIFPKYVCIFALGYLVGVLIHYLAHYLFYWFKDWARPIRRAYKRYHETLRLKGETRDMGNEDDGNKIIKEYYIKYYEVVKPGESVTIMETQVSFLRSMLFVIPIGVRAIYAYVAPSLGVWWVPIITIIMWGAMFLAIYYIQVRLSFRVFEDYYYLKIIGGKDKAVIEGEFSKEGVKVKLLPDK